MKLGKAKKSMLVYQAGLANVFKVECFNLAPFGRNATRIYQGDFDHAYALATGMGYAGCVVRTAYCNQAGDIANSTWSDDRESQPFTEKLLDANFN